MSVFTSVRSDLPELSQKSRKLVLSAEIERTLESFVVSEVAVSVDRWVGRRGLEMTGLVGSDSRIQFATMRFDEILEHTVDVHYLFLRIHTKGRYV